MVHIKNLNKILIASIATYGGIWLILETMSYFGLKLLEKSGPLGFLWLLTASVVLGAIITFLTQSKDVIKTDEMPEVIGKDFIISIDSILKNIKDETQSSFKGLFQSWLGQLKDEITHSGNVFDIHSNYYEKCIVQLQPDEIFAIADLSDPIEQFWFENENPIGTRVKQRIFLLDWNIFFDKVRLERFVNIFKANKKYYNICIGHVPIKYGNQLNLFPSRIGHHLLIGPPFLVGGYIKKNNQILLRMVRDKSTHEQAKEYYNYFLEHSIEYNENWTADDFRKEWIKHNKIGLWQNSWGDIVEERSPDYFINYDLHIRCWIPRYNDFIQGCFELIRHYTIDRFRNSPNKKIRILEIGYGTGALAEKIISWIHQFDKPLEDSANSISYYGIDPAKEEMLSNSNYHIENSDRKYFLSGTAFNVIPEKLKSQIPFDIICASLVLHDLNTDKPEKVFPEQLKKFNSLLPIGGVIIIADLFGTENKKEHQIRFEYWTKFLKSNLSEEATNTFLTNNNDMVNCITEEKVHHYANLNNYKVEFTPLKKGERVSPFKYLILTKIR